MLQLPIADVHPDPVSQGCFGHTAAAPHDPTPVQVTSHAHASPHSIAFAQLLAPRQLTSQSLRPHCTPFAQALTPLHITVHVVAPLQLMPPAHELASRQATLHGTPG